MIAMDSVSLVGTEMVGIPSLHMEPNACIDFWRKSQAKRLIASKDVRSASLMVDARCVISGSHISFKHRLKTSLNPPSQFRIKVCICGKPQDITVCGAVRGTPRRWVMVSHVHVHILFISHRLQYARELHRISLTDGFALYE